MEAPAGAGGVPSLQSTAGTGRWRFMLPVRSHPRRRCPSSGEGRQALYLFPWSCRPPMRDDAPAPFAGDVFSDPAPFVGVQVMEAVDPSPVFGVAAHREYRLG